MAHIKLMEATSPKMADLAQTIADEAIALVKGGRYKRLYEAVPGIINSGEHMPEIKKAMISEVFTVLGNTQG